MSKTKNTKSALLMSFTSLLLCFAMLIGSTFAWFTDSATASVNTIKSGTLDVQLLDESGNSLEGQTLKWVRATATADGAEFVDSEEILWEPGCTYNLQPIVIKNNGNLALKYKIIINGIQGDAPLNNAIEWTINDAALDADHSLAAGAYDTLTISGHMKESAGNEYQGLSIDNIAITVVATQDTVEYDSTTNQYDARAEYPVLVTDVAAMKDALAQGSGNIVLTQDVTVEDDIQMSVTEDTAIDFNGNTLTGAVESGSISSSDGPTNLVLSDPNNSGEYSIDSNIVVHEGGGMTQIAAITAWQPTVTVESGKYTHDANVVLCQLQTQDPNAVGVVINGGTFDGKDDASVVTDVIGRVVINDGTFNAQGTGAGECVWLDWGSSTVPSITTINGGTFNAEARIFYVSVNTSYTQKIVINGGTFNVTAGGSLIQVSSGNASDYLTITGGTFNVDPSAYVASGYQAAANGDGTWTVTAN